MTTAASERRRCINIVREYRSELTRAYASKPFAPNAKQVLALINKLAEMENRMAKTNQNHVSTKPKSEMPELEGGFTVEEMEKAAAIIAEQEHNPFEV